MAFSLPEPWAGPLADELAQPYLAGLAAFLAGEAAAGRRIYPAAADRFRALALTPPDAVKVVILGQDPYHGPGQAHGLAFSVPAGVRAPPSLRNIQREIARDLGLAVPANGCLEHWAAQGVLLLNSVLSVEVARAGSHARRGWERFTDAVIRAVDERARPSAFLLWGAYAQKKAAFVDTRRHLVLAAAHPSPLSAHNGFMGCGHFSAANAFLVANGRTPIDWSLPAAEPPLR